MNEPATAVIKNNEVRMAGKVRLGGAGHSSMPAGAPAAQQNQQGANAARVVRMAEDHVMIEVTCGCGSKTMVRCNF